jgi:MFS family permease
MVSEKRRRLRPEPKPLTADEAHIRRSVNRKPVQFEASGFGMMNAIHNAFINPLLVDRGASPIALGVFNSGANAFLYSAGFIGPRVAYRVGNLGKAVLAILLVSRIILFSLVAFMWAVPDGAVWPLLGIVLIWTAGEGLAPPLWTAFVAGLVPAHQRGRWLAMRGAAAATASACVMLILFILLQFVSKEDVLPLAYTMAAMASAFSLFQLKSLFHINPQQVPPKPKSFRSFPEGRERRRFLGGVFVFWFGAGFVWPILPAFIINDLGAPTAYFAFVGVLAAVVTAIVQRRWGRHGDQHGPRAMVYYSGIGASAVPILWALVPVYQVGPLVEIVASSAWPGHTLGLTMRAVELAESDEDRSTMIAWTSLAQGAGACVSPLVASLLVSTTGAVALLIVSAVLRWVGTIIISEAEREGWFRGRGPFRRLNSRRIRRAALSQS